MFVLDIVVLFKLCRVASVGRRHISYLYMLRLLTLCTLFFLKSEREEI